LEVSDTIRFGGDFELDVRLQKLRRAGRALKLERVPMEILLLLIEQNGQLVTREQIIGRVWGTDVFLDTDNSINGAIRKVRQVLKDDPEQPRFIQTITGKGYRFIAPVVDAAPDPEPAPVISPPLAQAVEGSRKGSSLWWWVLPGIAVILLAVLGYFRWSQSRSQAALSGQRTMLAVLPFENLTGDADQEYFSDGMTEEMISQLGSLDPAHIGVIARTSVMHYKHSPEKLQQIARELGVQYVLEGSVRGDADKVRITAQLIQMRDQTHLWARQYDRETKDVLVLQSEIATEISDEIRSALGERKPIAPTVEPTLSPQAYEAYNLYLKGQYFLNKRTIIGFHEAINYFQQATEKDPGDARAYAGLADAYTLVASYQGSPAEEFASRAHAAARRALQLDDSLPEAHAAYALIVQNHDYDWQTAEKEFKRAIELNPNYATGHHWYAEHLAWRGRFDEALRESERARQLDPLSLIIAADHAAILYYARQYDRAIAQFKVVRELDPDFPRGAVIFCAYMQKGMFEEARAVIDKPGVNPWQLSNMAYLYGRAGDSAKARQKLKELLELNQRQSVDPIVVVQAYVGMGNNDEAIAWLEKAYLQHSNNLTALNVEPVYDPLRDDPRFQNLLRRVGLAQ
jgi:TolB-like protein/DNA-binding winged helix-turn-helix (wHTH) protein/Flp pilus assembly protein TadD